MILQVVCIKDTALDEFERPFFVPALQLAIRHFGDEIGNPESPMNKHPEDYFLHHLGEYDTEDASFEAMSPRQIARGLDYIKKPQ